MRTTSLASRRGPPMNEMESTTAQRPVLGASAPATSRRRVNNAAMLQLPAFADEPTCSEPAHCVDDILLSGSDDEYYDDSDARTRRIEEQARLFLEGRRPLLLSASLKGPFDKASGWENPWRGRGCRVTKNIPPQAKAHPAKAQITTAPIQLDNSPSILPPLCARRSELGTTPGIAALRDSSTEPKKRSASTDWLRQRNLKRMRPADDNTFTPSPTATRVTRSTAFGRAFKTPISSRSFSAPLEPCMRSFAKETGDTSSSASLDDALVIGESISHISNSERSTSLPSDLLWESHVEHGLENTPSAVHPDTAMPDLPSDADIDAVKEDAPADMASQQIAAEEAQFGSQKDGSSKHGDALEVPVTEEEVVAGLALPQLDIHTLQSPENTTLERSEGSPTPNISEDDIIGAGNIAAAPDVHTAMCIEEQTTDHFMSANTITAARLAVEQALRQIPGETRKAPTMCASSDAEDERLATQFQSPWSKTQPALLVEDNIAEEATAPAANIETNPDTTTKPPVSSANTQSPWSRETQWQLPAPRSPPVVSTTPARTISLSQNPWAEDSAPTPAISSSQPNLPTSPCSSDQDISLPQFPGEQRQEPFLPSLPIPIPNMHSSGTAPSTPDTKQSSLPTPDMTVSIKSFRRFRSPTPTPPPRRRNNKKGGLRSILKQTRRSSGVAASASPLGRRVHFSLPDDEKAGDSLNCPADVSMEAKDEEDFIEAGLSGTSRGRQFTCKIQAGSSKAPSRPSHRASSPPPQDKTLMESLPSEVQKFQGHFASVAGRANAATASASTLTPSCAAKASSLSAAEGGGLGSSAGSPEVDAMAARFQEVDAETSKLQLITLQQAAAASQRPQDKDNADSSSKFPGTFCGDKENAWAAVNSYGGQEGGDDDAESVVDDVQEVMDNLDDFLGMWDMDAELAQVRSSRV